MTLKLEEGKYYVDVRGRKIGPMSSKYRFGYYKWHAVDFGGAYTALGRYWSDCTSVNDLVSEWVEPKVEPELTPFGELTPVEQGELLLAFHNREALQYYSPSRCGWYGAYITGFSNACYYRIKPKPKMQAEYWVVFRDNGTPLFLAFESKYQPDKGHYKVHHPAVEIKE